MQFKLFVIPISNPDKSINELNAFLRSRKIIAKTQEFINANENSFYCIMVEYLETPYSETPQAQNAVDYKGVLSEKEFELFSYLREVRKEIAEKEGIPVFAVFTNAQLAHIATHRVKDIAGLMQINGIGKGKTARFGETFLNSLTKYYNTIENSQEQEPDKNAVSLKMSNEKNR